MWYLLQGSIIIGFSWWISVVLYDSHPDRYQGQAIGLFGGLIALLVTGYINAAVARWHRWRAVAQEVPLSREEAEQEAALPARLLPPASETQSKHLSVPPVAGR
jgi:hypothetical protein